MSYLHRVRHIGQVLAVGLMMSVLLSSCAWFERHRDKDIDCGPKGPQGEWLCPKVTAPCGKTCGGFENRKGCNNNPNLTCRTVAAGGVCDCQCMP